MFNKGNNKNNNLDLDFDNKEKIHKKYAVVSVANGDGIKELFSNIGVDVVVSGTTELTVKTDRFGNYIIRNLPRGGTYPIKPVKKRFSFYPFYLSTSFNTEDLPSELPSAITFG